MPNLTLTELDFKIIKYAAEPNFPVTLGELINATGAQRDEIIQSMERLCTLGKFKVLQNSRTRKVWVYEETK